MQYDESASWRFAEGVEQLPLVALFVRDAAGLEVPPSPSNPPRLEGDLPDHSAQLGSELRATAGAFWAGWWRGVIALDVRQHQGVPRGASQGVWFRQRADEHRAVFDPPEFTSLADRPALREVVRATFEEALRWTDERRRNLLFPPAGRIGQFDYETTRAVAEEVAGRHRVSPGAVRACAVVLPVEADWWQRFAPGAVLCSVNAARDPATARTVLADAFESGLATD